ncbi:MAG: MATE family efflux transporter [Clostridia bacterium]|nr:MATE family efflux transporter [Clostridia bacterium]
MLVTTFYNMADTFFVSRLGKTEATGAVGVAFALMALIQSIGFFFGQGSANYISRSMGAGKRQESEEMAAVGFFSAIAFGAVLMLVGLVFVDKLAFLLGSTKTINAYARDYLMIILLGTPIQCGSMVMNNQLRFQGNATYGMIGIISGAVLNVALDPLLILALGLEVRGAAIATVAGQIVSFVILFICVKKSRGIQICWRNFKPKGEYFGQLVNGGMPSLCRQGIASVGMIALNHVAKGIGGDAAITAMSICSRMILFLNSVMIGFGQGFQPVCGYNYGAGKYRRVKESFWFCVRFSFVFLLVISVVGVLFSNKLVGIFSDDRAVLDFAAPAFRFMCISFPLNAWIVMCNMSMQTMGKGVRASFMSVARQGLTFIPLIIFLPMLLKPYGLANFGFESAQMWADILTFIISIPLQLSVLKELKETPMKE